MARSGPIVGITCDLVVNPENGRDIARSNLDYSRRVASAGGVPMLLPPIPDLIPAHLAACHAFVLTGGDDPRMEAFGGVTHPSAAPMHPQRQLYETVLLRELERHFPHAPVLGVCLGMQLMALVAGGDLDQHLPDSLPTHDQHKGHEHPIVRERGSTPDPAPSLAWLARSAPGARVASFHRQAVSNPGGLRVVARAPDGVIESLCDPSRAFYLGVQWHPERTKDAALGQGVFEALVEAARSVSG